MFWSVGRFSSFPTKTVSGGRERGRSIVRYPSVCTFRFARRWLAVKITLSVASFEFKENNKSPE